MAGGVLPRRQASRGLIVVAAVCGGRAAKVRPCHLCPSPPRPPLPRSPSPKPPPPSGSNHSACRHLHRRNRLGRSHRPCCYDWRRGRRQYCSHRGLHRQPRRHSYGHPDRRCRRRYRRSHRQPRQHHRDRHLQRSRGWRIDCCRRRGRIGRPSAAGAMAAAPANAVTEHSLELPLSTARAPALSPIAGRSIRDQPVGGALPLVGQEPSRSCHDLAVQHGRITRTQRQPVG